MSPAPQPGRVPRGLARRPFWVALPVLALAVPVTWAATAGPDAQQTAAAQAVADLQPAAADTPVPDPAAPTEAPADPVPAALAGPDGERRDDGVSAAFAQHQVDAGFTSSVGIDSTGVAAASGPGTLTGLGVDAAAGLSSNAGTTARTDDDGTYTLRGLPFGSANEYRVAARPAVASPHLQGWAGGTDSSSSPPVTVPTRAGVSGVDIALVRGSLVAGRVTDEDGAPAAGVSVFAYSSSFGPGSNGSGYTAADGTFTTTALAGGTYTVSFADHSGGCFLAEYFDDARDVTAATPVVLTAGTDRSGVDAVLAQAASISGTVTTVDGGAPGPASVTATDARGATFFGSVTPATGAYVVRGLADGAPTHGHTEGYPRVMPKVMVSLPSELLVDLDREAARRGSSRSALLATAARRELGQQDAAELDALLERARASMRSAGSFESGDLVRAERDR